ncbi:MAG TPA: hypothetical protein VF365_01465 [Candidatus Limnocylindria bacterium]
MPSAVATPLPQASPTPPPTPEPTPEPVVKDLSARPQIWFSPLDPSPPDASRPFNGGPDFMALFEEDAPWEHAADAMHVFKLYGGWVAGAATDDELRRVVGDLNRRSIAIGFEASPLRYGSDCAAWLDEGRRITRRLQEAGAVVRYVAFDHPYDTGVLGPAPDGCGLSPEQAAQGVAEYAAAIRERFPDIVIGSIETAANEVAEVERWVDAYRSAAGEDLDFFHLDLNFARPDWPEATLEIETFLRRRGIEIGMIYFGNWEDRSDAVWLGRVEDRFTRYELLGGRPDHAIFQSWHPYPQRILPETYADAFTAIIPRYLRPRTQLTVELDAGSLATGRLTGGDGSPLAAREVTVSVVPTDGPGLWHEYTVSGTAPSGAGLADVGYRVNTECACQGRSQFTLASVRYAEGWVHDAQQPYEVPIPSTDLATGSADWAIWGTAPNWADAEGLHVSAEPGQDAAANSPRFAVTGGASYMVTFVARVAPESLGSGYFSIIFNDGHAELTRQLIPLAAAVVPLGTATTDRDGRYQLTIDPVAVSRGALRAEFAGSDEAWPARAEVPISR